MSQYTAGRDTPKESKICATCGRPFTIRKKWRNNWDAVKYCSERCRNHRNDGAPPK